jgi:Cupin domain
VQQILTADLLGHLGFADGCRIATDGDIDQSRCHVSFISTFPPSRWHSLSERREGGLLTTPGPNGAIWERASMKIVRFASASDGGSQFVDVDLPIDNASTDAFGNTVHRSAILPAQSTMVTEMPEGLYQDWHPASRRQLLVVLSGTLEVETSDGRKHRCSSGDVFLADDVGSRGHRTRTIGGPARVLFIHLPPEANLGA